MHVNVERNNQTVILKVEGRLDTTTAPVLEKTVNEVCENAQELVLDLEKLVYISSAGLRVLLATQKKMHMHGSVKLIKVCREVMDILEMTGFADILVIE